MHYSFNGPFNGVIKYEGFILIIHQLFGGTWIEFDDQVCYTIFPFDCGPTLQMFRGYGDMTGQIHGPGSFIDLRSVMYNKRDALIMKDGYSHCLSLKRLRDVTYISGSNTVLPSNTMGLLVSGELEFKDRGQTKHASRYDLIVDRPYELNLIGQAELFLIPK